eukprot:GEMP01060991.1.p1 GENE.GEMP01060991.1~~GEMP01060991.1.p1  ORF type:complete len:408 (+),score=76.84 GEMP01060991.1:81-1304(+)
MIALTFAAVATANTFNFNITGKTSLPSYKGDANIQGSVKLVFDGTKVKVEYDLTNLEEAQCTDAKNACGIHIHKGTTCDDPQDHFWTNMTTVTKDPWTVIAYMREAASNSTTSKAASPSFEVGYNGTEAVGHVFVVHDKDGNKAACTVIPKPEERVAPKFSHTAQKIVKIGVTGEVTIVVSSSKTMQVRFDSRLKGLIVEKSTYVVSISEVTIAGILVKITKEAPSSSGSAIWSLLFEADTEENRTKLTVEVLSRDCRVVTTTTSTTTEAVATTTTSTTTTKAAETTTTSTTTTKAAETTTTSTTTTKAAETSTTTSTTAVPVGEPTRRLEANEATSTTESAQTTEEEEEEEESCDAGFSCHETLKSCQVDSMILPAGSAGRQGNNSNAAQNSAYAIVTAMVAYLMM